MRKQSLFLLLLFTLVSCASPSISNKEQENNITELHSDDPILEEEEASIDSDSVNTASEFVASDTSNSQINESKVIEMDDCGGNYCNSQIDSESFEMLSYTFSKDKNNVYYGGENYSIIRELDAASFEFVTESYQKDKNGVYFLWKGKTWNLVTLNADPATFTKGSFIADKDHIFVHPTFQGTQLKMWVEGADRDTFQVASGGFFKDKSHLFYGTTAFDGPDLESFSVIDFPFFKDKDYVYFFPLHPFIKFPDVDVSSFELLEDGMNSGYIIQGKDEDHFYEFRIDPEDLFTFSKLNIFSKETDPVKSYQNTQEDLFIDTGVSMAYAEYAYEAPLRRAGLAVIASKLKIGMENYNQMDEVPSALMKEKLDVFYTDVPEDKSWNQWILKGMYYARENQLVMGVNEDPKTFRATQVTTGLDFIKMVQNLLGQSNSSFADFLAYLQNAGVISEYNASKDGFLKVPMYSADGVTRADFLRIDFNQPMLYEDVGIFLYALNFHS